MLNTSNNFGLNGQLDSNYDNFICFSKKCKERKALRKSNRLQKRASKRNTQKAVIQELNAGVEKPMPSFMVKAIQNPPRALKVSDIPPPTKKASILSNPMTIVGVLIVAGAVVYTGFQVGKSKATINSSNINK